MRCRRRLREKIAYLFLVTVGCVTARVLAGRQVHGMISSVARSVRMLAQLTRPSLVLTWPWCLGYAEFATLASQDVALDEGDPTA